MNSTNGHAIAYTVGGFLRIVELDACFHVESYTTSGKWKKLAGIYDREKAIKFMETWYGS